MTGYTVHTGSSEKFSGGWDKIFGQKQAGKAKSAQRKPAKKKPAGKPVKRKSARKSRG